VKRELSENVMELVAAALNKIVYESSLKNGNKKNSKKSSLIKDQQEVERKLKKMASVI
jgi:hypothetical protein